MPKVKKDSKTINCNIQRDIYEQLEAYCMEMGQTKTMAIERILKQFFDNHYQTASKEMRSNND